MNFFLGIIGLKIAIVYRRNFLTGNVHQPTRRVVPKSWPDQMGSVEFFMRKTGTWH